jgi:hypothetical protein
MRAKRYSVEQIVAKLREGTVASHLDCRLRFHLVRPIGAVLDLEIERLELLSKERRTGFGRLRHGCGCVRDRLWFAVIPQPVIRAPAPF